MKEQFVTFEIALKLKELGFDEECLAYYTHPDQNQVFLDKDENKTRFVLLSRKTRGELVGHGSVRNRLFRWLLDNDKTYGELHTLANSTTAPLYQQVIEWLRQKHNIDIVVRPWTGDLVGTKTYAADVMIFGTTTYIKLKREDTYEKALEAGLEKALTLLK